MIDLSFLEKFTKGDTRKMKRYINMYLNIAPKTFNTMKENIKSQDWEQLRIQAHSLKPQADYMDIAKLKKVLGEIENEVQNGAYDSLKNLYDQALDCHVASERLLKLYVEKL